MKKELDGSLTIEASILLPMLILVLALFLFLGFSFHDRLIVQIESINYLLELQEQDLDEGSWTWKSTSEDGTHGYLTDVKVSWILKKTSVSHEVEFFASTGTGIFRDRNDNHTSTSGLLSMTADLNTSFSGSWKRTELHPVRLLRLLKQAGDVSRLFRKEGEDGVE